MEPTTYIDNRHTSQESLAEAFARDGAVHVKGLLNRNWVALLEQGLEEVKGLAVDVSNYYGNGKGRTGESLIKDDCWMASKAIRDFLAESPLAATMASVMGSSEARLYEDLLIYKSAGDQHPTPWHQDEPQWPLTGGQMCSAWLCLDPVTGDTGSLRFATGTHRGPMYRPFAPAERQADVDADMIFFDGGELPDVDASAERFKVMHFDTQPGDVVIFHPRCLHAAFGSAPDRPRRTFSFRFIGDDVRWQPKRSVFHSWLKDIPLQAGDRVSGDRFPLLFP